MTFKKLTMGSQAQWLTPVIPAIQEIEIRRLTVQSQPQQKVSKTITEPIAGQGGEHLSPQICRKHK
jgi:hypothetical protein